MLDRGLARGFDAEVEREAAQAARPRPARVRARRRDLRELATFTIDPLTARDFDDAISAERIDGRRGARVGAHRRRERATLREGSLARPRGAPARARACTCPGRSSRCCRRRSRATPARCRPGAIALAVTVELELHGAEVVRTAFYRSLIRSDERLDYERVDRIFAGARARRGAVGRAAAAPRAGGRGAAARARAARRARARLRGARVQLRRAGQRRRDPRRACRPSPIA